MARMRIKIDKGDYRLSPFFVEYVESKIKGGRRKGRPHLVKQLGTLENLLEVLNDLWLEGKPIIKEAEKLVFTTLSGKT